jgi:hypothetical protein
LGSVPGVVLAAIGDALALAVGRAEELVAATDVVDVLVSDVADSAGDVASSLD